MSFVEFPDIIPSSMDFAAPRFSVGSDTSLGGVSTRRKFGNRQYDGRLTVEFRNLSNDMCAQIYLLHYQSNGLSPIQFKQAFFRGAGDDLQLFLDCSAYPGLLWYFIEDAPPRLNRVEGGASVSNLSVEFAARLLPNSTGSSVAPILPDPLPSTGGGTAQPPQRVSSVSALLPLSSTGGTDPVLSIALATPSSDGSMSATDKAKLDGIQAGAQQAPPTNLSYTALTRLLESSTGTPVTLPLFSASAAGLTPTSPGGTVSFLRADGTWAAPPASATNLSYTPSTRLLESSTGTDVTLPLVSSSDAGLVPASGGGTANFLRADGTWTAPSKPASTTVSRTTATLAAAATEDFTISAGKVFNLLSFVSSTPSWIRIYGSAAARAADTRTQPGGTLPLAGSEYYAELVTTTAPQTITMSPVAIVQGTAGIAYARVVNMDTVSRSIQLNLKVLTLEE